MARRYGRFVDMRVIQSRMNRKDARYEAELRRRFPSTFAQPTPTPAPEPLPLWAHSIACARHEGEPCSCGADHRATGAR